MKRTTGRVLLALALMSAAPLSARADEALGFTPHYLAYNRDDIREITPRQNSQLSYYIDNEIREPCQSYHELPEGFVRVGCKIMIDRPEPPAPAPQAAEWYTPPPVAAPAPAPVAPAPAPQVLASYQVYFPFDSSRLDASSQATLDRVANEINQYHPSTVDVWGHADRSGPGDYNMRLSQRRADSVSHALVNRGVANRVMDEQAFGETRPAIPTPDGVRKAENRRVEIQFMK